MKKLRIMLSLMLLVSVGAWLSATENIVLDNEQQSVPTPKTAQADTVRMIWKAYAQSFDNSFSFKGEKGATYKVDWGDGETETIKGEGNDYGKVCSHYYTTAGTYTVLLYGVSK